MNWSEYQLDIFNFESIDKRHGLIQAGPGAGKTATSVELTNHINARTLFLAFSTKIAGVLQTKVKRHVDARTFNSFGWRLCHDAYPNVQLDTNKTFNILKGYINPDSDKELFYAVQGPMRKIVSILKNMNKTVTDDWRDCAYQCGLELPDWSSKPHFHDAFENILPQVYEESIKVISYMDYDDQVFQPIFRDLPVPRIPYVFVDEAQDLNAVNIELLQSLVNNGARLLMVGDEYQCQPTGTMVSSLDKEYKVIEKPIEELKRWDKVISLQNPFREWRENYVEEVASNDYSGELIKITTRDGSTSYYTPNHKCLADYRMLRGYSCVYIMRKGNNFRIGKSNMHHEGYGAGICARVKAERAHDAWILGIYGSDVDAYTAEQILAVKYNLPQTVFVNNSRYNSVTQARINNIWEAVGNNVDQATKCLEAFGRDIKYPLITNNMIDNISLNRLMEVRACNLLDKCQVVRLFYQRRVKNDTTHNRAFLEDFQEIKVERVPYEGKVWSLKVNRDETYVADGIATHNSIMSFRGSCVDSMDILRQTFSPHDYQLPICYRCPDAVIRRAQQINPNLQAPNPNPNGEGFTENIKLEKFRQIVEPRHFVISRTTLPLVSEVMKLVVKGTYAYVEGKEVTESLFRMIDRIWYGRMQSKDSLLELVHDYKKGCMKTTYDIVDFIDEMQSEVRERIPRLEREGKEDQIEILTETADTIYAIAESCEHVPALIDKIETIFKNPEEVTRPAVRAMTCHKVKGLENKIIHHLFPSDIPHYKAVKSNNPAQLKQERNLMFVADTRAQEGTYYVAKPMKGH